METNFQSVSLSKFSVPNPHKIEVTWGLLRPKVVTGKISKIICCAFYSQPYSKKKTKLIDHLSSTLQDLLLDHPGAAIVIAGDRNDLSVGRILSIESSLQQIVSAPTHGKSWTLFLQISGSSTMIQSLLVPYLLMIPAKVFLVIILELWSSQFSILINLH